MAPGSVRLETTTHMQTPRLSLVVRLEEWLMSRSFGVRRAALIAYWTFIFFMTHWPKVEDFAPVHWFPVGSDKVAHFSFYAGWTALWCWVLYGQGRTISRRVVGWLVAGAALYAVTDELTQAIVGRDPEVGDFIADMIGVTVALFLMSWFFRRRSRIEIERRREPVP